MSLRWSLAVLLCAAMSCSGSVENSGGDGGADADANDVPAGAPLRERLSTASVTVPSGALTGVLNNRIWGSSSLGVSPVFTVPLANCQTLVGYTGMDGTARAVRLAANGALVETHTLAASRELRGLAAEPDGHFGALLWDDAGDQIFVHRFDAAGGLDFSEELTNSGGTLSENYPDDFGIGESRLDFGDGQYGATYHVHTPFDGGHEGETIKYVTTAGVESTSTAWGCSHSMSAAMRYSDGVNKFMPACVTDCFPGTASFPEGAIGGIYINASASKKVMDVDGACNGKVAAELGSAAPAAGGWMLVFNAHQAPATLGPTSYDAASMNQDIGVAAIAADYSSGSVTWLTTTSGDEADSSIAQWQPAGEGTEQYLVGWSEPGGTYSYQLARLDSAGNILEGPTDVSDLVAWGKRDDPMRKHVDGDVIWAWFDAAGSTTLNVARIDSGKSAACASF